MRGCVFTCGVDAYRAPAGPSAPAPMMDPVAGAQERKGARHSSYGELVGRGWKAEEQGGPGGYTETAAEALPPLELEDIGEEGQEQ